MKQKLSKLLIVDDDTDILTISKYSLSLIPEIDIHCAASGEECVKKTLEIHPDLILLDLMMPNMDGRATLKAIKLIPSVADIPIVFFTARSQQKDLEELLELGAIDIIPKPFDPTNFPAIVEGIWNKYQAK